MAPSTSTLLSLAGNIKAEIGEKVSFFSQTEIGIQLLHDTFNDSNLLRPLHESMSMSDE